GAGWGEGGWCGLVSVCELGETIVGCVVPADGCGTAEVCPGRSGDDLEQRAGERSDAVTVKGAAVGRELPRGEVPIEEGSHDGKVEERGVQCPGREQLRGVE